MNDDLTAWKESGEHHMTIIDTVAEAIWRQCCGESGGNVALLSWGNDASPGTKQRYRRMAQAAVDAYER